MRTPKRVTRNEPLWRARMASAVTPAERLDVAHDRLRAGLRWLGRRQGDIESRACDRDLADSLADEAAEFLTALADRIDAQKKVTRCERQPVASAG